MKIKKTASAKHEANTPPYIRIFVATVVDLPIDKLEEHLESFPKLWPFPRGDLYQWIPVLNKFDDVLDDTIKKYKLKDGPQTIPWEASDEKTTCSILNFSRMLVEECGNRSLYASSAHINDLLNTTSLDVLEACLRLGARLAQRYYTSKSRGQSVNATNQALLLSHYNIKLEKVISLCLPFVKYAANVTANTPKGATFKAAVPAYANDLGAIVRELPEKAEDKSTAKSDEWDQWGRVLVSYYATAPKSPTAVTNLHTPGPSHGHAPLPHLTEPTSPTLSRRATHPPPNLATPTRRPTGTAEEPATAVANDGMQALEIPSSKVKNSSMEEILKAHLPTLPAESHYEFLQNLRVSWALTHGLKKRRQILGIRILAITNAAYVLSESAFNSKILALDQNEPRRLQLAYQLADLVSGTANANSTERSEVPRQLQAYAFGALEALARQKTKTTDVCAALSMNVNHGVLMYVVRKMLAELSAESNPDGQADGGEEWRNALFGLLQFLPNAAHTGQLVVAAGLVPMLVEILNLRTPLGIRAMPKVITLTDALLYSVVTAFQAFTNAKGLDAVVDLVFDEVEASFKEVENADSTFEQYRSPSVDFKISHIRQHTLKSLWKFLHHMMMQNAGGNDRLLRNLIDNTKSIQAMKMVMANGSMFGNGVWSSTVNVFSAFIHNEPTSYAAIHEAGLSQVMLEAVGGRVPKKEEKTEVKEDGDVTAAPEPMDVEPTSSTEAPAAAKEEPIPTDDLSAHILPAADAMQQVLNAFGAICLNTAGLALFQSSGALERFFEIFRSPAHVKVLVDGETARNIGNQIDEIARHHPVLKDSIIEAVMGVCRHTLEIGEKFAVEKGAGAKVWVEDGKGGMVVSGGRRAITGATRASKPVAAPAAPEAAAAPSSDVDVQMADAGPAEPQREELAVRESDGSLPNEIVTSDSVVDDDDITEGHDAHKEPGISSYIEATANFLDGFIQNKQHAKDFIEHNGLELALQIYSLPSLPYNFAVRPGSSALSRVMHFCSDQSAPKTTAVILKHSEEAIKQLKPLLDYMGSDSFFAPLIDQQASTPVAPRLQSGPPSDMDTDNLQSSSEFLKVDGTTTIKALVTVHGIVSLLGELYNQSAFSARAFNPLSNAITSSPIVETLIPLLGELQRTCVWEEIVLQRTIPETWNKATKTPDSLPMMVEETIAEATDEATKPAIDSPKAAEGAEKEKTPDLEGKVNTCWFKNVKTIRFLMSEIPTCITPFLQGLSRSLLMRRNLDLAQKQTAFKAAELITNVAHKHLTWERIDTAKANIDKHAYWIIMLSTISSLLIDESHGTQAIVLTLKTFLQNGGIKTVVTILETLWAELERLPPPTKTDLSKEERAQMAHIFGTIKVILSLFTTIVSHKAVSESQQAVILAQNREPERPDYFVPEHFLVELRYAVLPAVHKIWESPLFEKASSSNVKCVIDVLSSILRGDAETNALRRAAKPKASRLSWRSMEPDQDRIRALTEMGFTEREALDALLRCNNNVERATERLIAFAQNPRPAGSGASRPQTTEADSDDSDADEDEGEQTDTEVDTPVASQAAAPEPAASEPAAPAPAPAQAEVEAPGPSTAPAVITMEIDVPIEEPSTDSRSDRLVVMSIDNLLSETIDNALSGNPEPPAAIPHPPPAPETEAPAASATDSKGKGKAADVGDDEVVAWEDLEEAREELRENLVSRCLDVLQVHDNITFELSALIQSAYHAKTPENEERRTEIAMLIVQSLVSLYDDDFRPKGKVIASTAHMLGLLLQDQTFFKACLEDLKVQIPELVNFLKMYPGEPAPWVPNILLVLEKMLAEDTEPKEVPLDIPEITNKLPFVEPLDSSVSFEDKLAIFDATTKLLPQVGKDESLALAIARVLSTLTRQRKLAERMIAEGHVKNLFAMVKAQTGTSVTRLQTCVIYILRHVIEDKETIKVFMRAEIKSTLSQIKVRNLDSQNFIKSHGHLALRDPEAFVEVVDELCKHKGFSPDFGNLKYQSIELKNPPPRQRYLDEPLEEAPEEKKDETMKEADGEATKEAPKEQKEQPKPELKPPVIDKPDGVIHFLVSELLAARDAEEPPLPKPVEAEKEGDAKAPGAAGAAAATGAAGATSGSAAATAATAATAAAASPFLFPQSKSDKPELKTANNPVFVYRIFLLQCLTEILASYNKSKIEFINFSRKAKPTEPFTPSKPRSSVLNYLIYDLVPVGTVQHSDEPATKKKATVSIWAIAVIVALTTQTSESPTEQEKSDLLFIRKFVLEALLKAFKEATAMNEGLDHRYSRLLGLSDIFSRMLTTGRQSSSGTSYQNESNKQLAKIMLDKNFIGALNLALAEMDLNFPHVRRAIKYILKPLLELSKTALLGEVSSETVTLGGGEEDEISTASSDVDDEDREETPDLYRHSALGMFEGDIQEDEESYDEDEDEEMMYEEEYDFDDEEEEEGSGSEMSDEANEIDPSMEMEVMHQEDGGSEDDEEDDLSDDMDEDGEEIEIVDELDDEDEEMDDMEGGDEDDLDDEEIVDDEADYDDDQGDWEEGPNAAADIVVNMDDPLESIARAIGADAMDDEFIEEGDEDDDEDDEDIDEDDEDDGRGDDLEVPVPWEWDQDMGAPPAFIARTHGGGRMGAGWATLFGGATRAEPVLGIRPMRVGHSGPLRADDQQLNPLLQPSAGDHAAHFPTAILRTNDGMTDWVHAFDVHNGGGTIQMMNTLLSVLSRSGQAPPMGLAGAPPFPFAAAIAHPHMPRGELSHRDLRTLFGGSRRFEFESRSVRDDVFTVVNSFTLATTRERWLEEARLLFGVQAPQEKALKVLNAIYMKLVPPAIEEDKIRKQREEEELKKETERKRIEEEELAAKKKQEEEERAKREEEERIAREKEEAERAAQAQAEAAEAGAQTTEPSASAAEAGQPAEAMEGVESTQPAEAAPAEPAPEVPPRFVVIRGQEVNVAPMGIDPDFLEALPEDMRDEVFSDHLRQRQITAQANNQPSDISPEFLDALPEEIRDEILAQEAADRRRREREAARQQAAASGQPTGPQEMDLATFLATLDPQLRQSVLLDQDDDALAQLPDTIAAEAAALRRSDRRMNHFADLHRHGHVHPRGDEIIPKPVKNKTIRKTYAQILDRAGVATLMRLMFLHLGHKVGEPLHHILLNVCENRQNRVEVINLLLSIIQDGSTDMVAVERCFCQLSLRARQTTNILKTPVQKRPQVIPQASNEISPLMVIHQCIATLSQLVSNNELIRSYFLNEHEVPTLVKRTLSRKGKGKEKEVVPPKSSKYALNILLSLLDRKLVTESTSVMDLLSALLSNITRPLTVLKKDRKKAEEAEKEKEKAAAAEAEQPTEAVAPTEGEAPSEEQPAAAETPASVAESAPAQTETPAPTTAVPAAQPDASTATAGPSTTKPDEKTEEQKGKKEKSLIPPVVPDANLRLVVNILSAPECSSKTFKETLTTMQNLSAIPGARDVFGEELIRQAQALGSVILQHLSELVPQIEKATSGTEVQGLALAKFSPASSDQAKLLRLLTALDYLFDPKREKKEDEATELDETSLPKLYERLTFGPLWSKLSDALTAIHERPEMLHIATILLPLIEALMVVCRGSGMKNGAARTQREKTPGLGSPGLHPEPSGMENLFFSFTEEHRKILNQMVRNNPKLMIGSFALLVNNPKVLEFDNKRNYFSRRLHTRTGNARESVPSLQLNVRRKDVFRDTYKSMYFKSGDEVKYAKLNIRFAGEEGVDAGGVTREWFQVLARAMFNPDYALFLPVASDKTTFHPNPMSSVNPEHLSFFKFIGRIIGKALYEGRVLDCHFSRAVYKRILGKNVSLKDMETLDLDYYKSLCWILENEIEDIITETFSVVRDMFGTEEIIDLVPNGRNIPVTDENKHEYVRLVVEHRLINSVKEQMEEFLKGFHDIVPAELVSIFNEQELELLISGLPDISVDDWKNNTEYHNYSASSPQIQWFWRAVRGFDKEERAKLLQFVTGTSKVPLNGFKELEGMNGVSKFNIHRDYGSKDRLPSSHTCFNQLDLPEYDSYEQLRTALYTAITQGADYFGFA